MLAAVGCEQLEVVDISPGRMVIPNIHSLFGVFIWNWEVRNGRWEGVMEIPFLFLLLLFPHFAPVPLVG